MGNGDEDSQVLNGGIADVRLRQFFNTQYVGYAHQNRSFVVLSQLLFLFSLNREYVEDFTLVIICDDNADTLFSSC